MIIVFIDEKTSDNNRVLGISLLMVLCAFVVLTVFVVSLFSVATKMEKEN